MVNSKSLCLKRLRPIQLTTIYYSPFTIHQKERSATMRAPFSKPTQTKCTNLSARRRGRGRCGRLHIDVNLCAAASKQPASKSKQNNHHDDHEDHQNRDDACAAA